MTYPHGKNGRSNFNCIARLPQAYLEYRPSSTMMVVVLKLVGLDAS